MIDMHRLQQRLPGLREAYRQARPFAHVIVDDFCSESALRQVSAAFPSIGDPHWIHYFHYNEKKHGLNKLDALPQPARALIEEMHSPDFVGFLSDLTGFDALKCDPDLEGGGLHQSERGGFLRIHADFLSHPHRPAWQRRLNVLLYLNESWDPAYGGDLEFWTEDMSSCQVKISPVFNRCVIFHTHATSFHGHPEPLACPAERTRKSIALYYYTEGVAGSVRPTSYRARPSERSKRFLIRMDNLALRSYHQIKRRFGIRDGVVSKVLGRLFQNKK
ncbi:MAG: 2OG-Fe(II) oxygenase [Saprospiraceae bacterium]|nr:2OG-Fe(II) oxygenase [Saprospiraceae bacterium]